MSQFWQRHSALIALRSRTAPSLEDSADFATQIVVTQNMEKKMTVRKIIKCDTCDNYIIARVLLGFNEHPSYSFNCPHCEEKVILDLNLYPKEGKWDFIFKENCIDVTTEEEAIKGEEEGVIINLSAELPISSQLQGQDMPFTAIMLMRHQELLTKKKQDRSDKQPDIHKNWKYLKRSINQTIKGKMKLAERYIKEYTFIYDHTKSDLDIFSQLHDFISFFIMPNKYIYVENTLKEMYEDQRKYKEEYLKFFKYFTKNLFENNLTKIVELINQYMVNYESLVPFLIYIREEKDIPEDICSTSFDFESLKLFYGQAFELISSLFEFLTIINNIHNGRKFNELESIDLEKYKMTDKANRNKAFSKNPVLSIFSTEFDPSIRNASHHNNFEMKNSETINYKSGKPLKSHDLPTREYLIRCNNIFINLVSIFDLFLFTNEFTRNTIKQWAYK